MWGRLGGVRVAAELGCVGDGLGRVPPVELADGAPVEDGLEASADFWCSCLAFRSDSLTAPWAFSIARVSPATPGAEGLEGAGAAAFGAGAAACGDGTEEPPPLPEWPRRAMNQTAASTQIAPRAT